MTRIIAVFLNKLNEGRLYGRKYRDRYGKWIIKIESKILVLILGIIFIQLLNQVISSSGFLEISSDGYLFIFGALFVYFFVLSVRKLILISVMFLILSALVLIVDASFLANQLAVFAYFLLVVVILLQIYSIVRGDTNAGK